MSNLIERKEAMEAIKKYGKDAISAGRRKLEPVDDIIELCNMLAALPAVDAAPVVHGRWRQDDEDAWTCTACGNIWTFLDGGPNENNAKYCPMCGAKMDVEGKNE